MSNIRPERANELRAIPLFRACRDRDLVQVDGLVDDIEVETGEMLIEEGRVARQSFVIMSGDAAVTRGGERLATLRAGDFFGEMALVDGSLRSATVTATTPMRILVLDPRSFWSLIGIANVAQVLLRGIVERLRQADEALASNR